jgi:hypothetical protein
MMIPAGLQHILEVYRLVRVSHQSRGKALNEVARKHRIDPQTIRSACTRSLGIATADLDDFLLPENSEEFCGHLVRRFPPYQKEIETFFGELNGKDMGSPNDPAAAIRTLFPDEKKDLVRLLLLDSIRKKLSVWSNRHDIPEDLRREMASAKEQIDKA